MSATTLDDDRESVLAVIQEINQAWLNDRVGDIARHFAEDVVFVAPGFTGRCEGRDPCVQSYADFMAAAKVHSYQESDHVEDMFGAVAVVSYLFEITYEMRGNTMTDRGRDFFVFERRDGTWKAVWRTMFEAK